MLLLQVVSKRIKEYGTKVLEGDLVLVDEVPEVPIEEEFVNDTDLDDELNVKPLEKPCPVRNLLSSELLNFTINDIVLPLPGTTVIYPKNKVSEWYHSFLIEDGLTTDSFTSKVGQTTFFPTLVPLSLTELSSWTRPNERTAIRLTYFWCERVMIGSTRPRRKSKTQRGQDLT